MRRFEREVADTLGKPDAVFMPSGVMAQQVALCIHSKGVGGSFVCHSSSHITVHEKDSWDHLLKMKLEEVDTKEPLSLSDVTSRLDSNKDVSTVLLEHPHRELGGSMTDWSEIEAMSKLCKERGVAFHLDGARIWEVSGAFGGRHSLSDIAAKFDSVYCSFYKGIGGMTGAVLLGNDDFCAEARVWLRRFGGNL